MHQLKNLTSFIGLNSFPTIFSERIFLWRKWNEIQQLLAHSESKIDEQLCWTFDGEKLTLFRIWKLVRFENVKNFFSQNGLDWRHKYVHVSLNIIGGWVPKFYECEQQNREQQIRGNKIGSTKSQCESTKPLYSELRISRTACIIFFICKRYMYWYPLSILNGEDLSLYYISNLVRFANVKNFVVVYKMA